MDRLHYPSNDRSSRRTLPTFIASKSYQAFFGFRFVNVLHVPVQGSWVAVLRGPDRILHVVDSYFHTKLRGATRLTNLLGAVNLGDVDDEVQDTAGVSPLVVVPGDELDEVVVEGDTSLGIEDGRGGVAVHVRGDNVVLSVGEVACF